MKLKGFLLIGLLVLLVLPSLGCKGDNQNFTIPIYIHNPGAEDPAVIVTDIYITPGWINVAVGNSQKFKAVGRFTDGHEEDFTGMVIWMIDGLDWTGLKGFFPTYGRLETTKAGTITVNVRYRGEIHGHALVSVFDPLIDAPPNPPKDLDYMVLPDDDVYLTWDIIPPPEPDLLGFNIYRSRTSGEGYEQLNYGVILGKYYRDNEAAGGVFYYVVTALDLGGNESDYSFELTVDKR